MIRKLLCNTSFTQNVNICIRNDNTRIVFFIEEWLYGCLYCQSTGLVRYMCTADSLLFQDDERQRTDRLICGLHIDLKKQIFLGIIIGNICFFVRKTEKDIFYMVMSFDDSCLEEKGEI